MECSKVFSIMHDRQLSRRSIHQCNKISLWYQIIRGWALRNREFKGGLSSVQKVQQCQNKYFIIYGVIGSLEDRKSHLINYIRVVILQFRVFILCNVLDEKLKLYFSR